MKYKIEEAFVKRGETVELPENAIPLGIMATYLPNSSEPEGYRFTYKIIYLVKIK